MAVCTKDYRVCCLWWIFFFFFFLSFLGKKKTKKKYIYIKTSHKSAVRKVKSYISEQMLLWLWLLLLLLLLFFLTRKSCGGKKLYPHITWVSHTTILLTGFGCVFLYYNTYPEAQPKKRCNLQDIQSFFFFFFFFFFVFFPPLYTASSQKNENSKTAQEKDLF